MTDYTRDEQFPMPDPGDSLVSSAGLTVVNNWIDQVDAALKLIEGQTAGAEPFLGVWYSTAASNYSLASSGTASNCNLLWVNVISSPGTGSATVGTTSNSSIHFAAEGFYRLTWGIMFTGASSSSEGFCQVGLKPEGSSTYITRTSQIAPTNTWDYVTCINKSCVVKSASAGGDVVPSTAYAIGVRQTNSAAEVMNVGGVTNRSFFAIEYLRPL